MLAWFRLIRASGLVTVIADIATAVLVAVYASEGLSLKIIIKRLVEFSGWHAVWVVVASLLLYCTGMIWNDIADVERDRVRHPDRPLPSGRINLVTAYIVGLLTAGGALVAATFGDGGATGNGHGFFACGVVLTLIFLYNLVTKDVPWLGSLTMALVRFSHAIFALLVLGPDYLKMAVLVHTQPGQVFVLAYPLVLGVYVFGLTLLSELEDRPSRRWELLAAGGLMTAAIAAAGWMLLSAHWLRTIGQADRSFMLIGMGVAVILGCILLAWLAASVLRPWWAALSLGRRTLIGPAVIAALGGLVLLDAVVAISANPYGGIVVASLIVVYLLGRLVARMD